MTTAVAAPQSRTKPRTQPPAAAPRPPAAPTEPARTPASLAAAFISMGSMLEISATGWAHWAGSCDAARLLLMARADIEEHAQRNINEAERAGDFALDIAALIKAARRAPGPAEPAEAKKLLDQAMADLAWIADMPVAELMADAAAPAAPQQDLAEWRKLACSANYEVQRLAQTMVRLADQLDLDAQPVFHGLAARIAQLSEIVYSAGRLHGEDPAEAGTPPLKDLQHIFAGGLCLD